MKVHYNRFVEWSQRPELIETFFPDNHTPVEKWEEEYRGEYQLAALRELLSHVYKNNDWYREKIDAAGLDVESFSDISELSKIGMTSKDDLRDDPYRVLSIPREEISQVFLSTGTTGGESIYMFHSWEDLYIRDIAPSMPMLAPLTKDMIIINALPYEMSSSGMSFNRVFQHGHHCGVVGVGKGGFYSDPEKTVKILNTLQATVIFTTPTYAIHLANVAQELDLDPQKDLALEKMWLTGEGCSDSLRKRIEKLYGAEAYFYYGSLEAGPLGIECEEQDGYHIPSGHVYVEIVDPDTGRVMGPGEIGEIVITTLLRTGSPLIRYRTQDLGYLEDIPCECGINLQKLYLRGRNVDQIRISGQDFSPFYVENFLMKHPEIGNDYRFIIHDEMLEIEIILSDEKFNTPEILAKIGSSIEYACGIPTQITVADNLGYTGGKTVRVVNKQKNAN